MPSPLPPESRPRAKPDPRDEPATPARAAQPETDARRPNGGASGESASGEGASGEGRAAAALGGGGSAAALGGGGSAAALGGGGSAAALGGGGSAAALRCPFCRGELPGGALAAACATCGTLHHPGCFAEHHGCSTHGCESTRGVSVVVGAPPPPPFSPLACARCRKACPGDAIVARCTCGRVQHTACYEQLGRCAGGRCQGQVELLPHRDAVHERLRERSGVLFKLGLSGLLLGGGGGWLIERLHLADTLGQADARALMLVAVVLALAGLLALYAGLGVRRRARAVATLPPRARADDAVKQLEKELGLGPG